MKHKTLMSKNESSRIKRISIAILGGFVVLIGLVTIPYPGPGWLIVFAGLGILSTEFDWARRLLDQLRNKYDRWQAWLRAQPLWVKAIFFILTSVIVIVTIWLLNGYGILNEILRLNQNWLSSPFVK